MNKGKSVSMKLGRLHSLAGLLQHYEVRCLFFNTLVFDWAVAHCLRQTKKDRIMLNGIALLCSRRV